MTESTDSSEFVYGLDGLSARDERQQRFFEILPGAISWGLLLGMVALSWFSPIYAIVCILAFDLLWVFYLGYAACVMIASALRNRTERDTDWMARLKQFDTAVADSAALTDAKPADFFQRLSQKIHRRQLNSLLKSGDKVPTSESIHHVVIFTISTESRQNIESVVASLLEQDFPLDRVMVILAPHEGAPKAVKKVAWNMHREHYERFAAFYVAPHPSAEEGRSPVKGAAVNFAARMAATAMEKEGVDSSNVIVSCLEASSYLSTDYLSCLTWKFLTCPDRERVCFQPVPAYHSNIWKAPAIARLLHVGSSFLHRIEATDPVGLVSFGSYSMSLKTIIDAGYWPDDELFFGDSEFFWKAFLRFDGRFRTVLTTSMISQDIVSPDTFKNTVETVYFRKEKDAKAIRNFPIVMRGFLQQRGIPLITKLRHSATMLMKQVGAATWVFLLLVIGWLPGLVANWVAPNSSLSYFAPRIHAIVALFALITLAIVALLSLLQLPKREPGTKKRSLLTHLWIWIVIPPLAIILTAYPYLCVQTRLMLGKTRR
ncbi:hypothetical protein NT6N_15450 [Oceaniferula spumae]|uniref:Glycosyltransferase 2-like domain-containing protein n=1 Tax=Oceaniferula spumae TaxID=2979115 RepID=A0AAT9FKH7_9BACT